VPPLPDFNSIPTTPAPSSSFGVTQRDQEGFKTIEALTSEERRGVIRVMAQAFCLQKHGTQNIPRAAAQVLRNDGISPSVAMDPGIQREVVLAVSGACP
jgi:hypothetical protein